MAEDKDTSLASRKRTGNYYFKPTLFGLILLIEVEYKYNNSKETIKEFHRAKITDLFDLKLISSTNLK